MRAILVIAACSLLAQEETTIRLDVQQVLVPVVVTDNKGHHVAGLRASDFRIFEDGVPQKIAAFSSDTTASINGVLAPPKPASPAAGPAAPRHTFVICVDTLHTSSANAARLREALENLFEKEKLSDAQYVLIGIGRQMQVLQPATANPLAILQKLHSRAFQESFGGLDASSLAAQLNNLRSRMEQFCKQCSCAAGSKQTCSAEIETLKQNVDADAARWTAPVNGLAEQFRQVVGELAKLPTGRTLILVSDNFNLNPAREFYAVVSFYLPGRPQFTSENSKDLEPPLQEALKIAADRNVVIYTVDSRGASTPSFASLGPMDASAGAGGGGSGISGRNSTPSVRTGTLQQPAARQAASSPGDETMERLAHSTGGVYFPSGNNMLKQFRSALADGRDYYTLAYAPTNNTRDGKFRRITVETTDKKLSIRAKPGYWPVGVAQ